MQFTPPYINLNGNSEQQITEELKAIYKALNSAIDALSKAEYCNGRNAIDYEHARKMKDEKLKALDTLNGLREGYIDMFVQITDKGNK